MNVVIRRLRLAAVGTGLWFLLTAGCVGGCVSTDSGRDMTGIKSTIAGFEQRNAVKVENTRKIVARDIKENTDAVLMRILGVGFVLMGLSYPIGKLVWCMGHKTIKTARRATRLEREDLP